MCAERNTISSICAGLLTLLNQLVAIDLQVFCDAMHRNGAKIGSKPKKGALPRNAQAEQKREIEALG